MSDPNPDLGDRVSSLEKSNADLSQRVGALETAVSSFAEKLAAIPRGLSQDDLNNAVQPLADEIATINAKVSELPPEAAAVLDNSDAKRDAWIDAVLSKFFSGEEPATAPDDTGRTG